MLSFNRSLSLRLTAVGNALLSPCDAQLTQAPTVKHEHEAGRAGAEVAHPIGRDGDFVSVLFNAFYRHLSFRADELASVGANGWDDAATVVVRDRDAWQATWNKMHERLAGPRPPLPTVDFSTEMVVVIALGVRSNSGFGVTITGASESDGVITVDALSTGPGPGCITAQVITYPIDVVRLPRRNSAVYFRVGPGVTSCR